MAATAATRRELTLQELLFRQVIACRYCSRERASLLRCALAGEPGPNVVAGELLYNVAVGYSSAGAAKGSICAWQGFEVADDQLCSMHCSHHRSLLYRQLL
jgi:hypothetical protein